MLDLGCGLGLLGILALRMGSDSVFFQDYVSKKVNRDFTVEIYINIFKTVNLLTC